MSEADGEHDAGEIGLPDEELARAAQRDGAAFALLYRRHLDRVYRYLLARSGEVALAQDLTAQTFLAALEAIGSYRGRGAFAAWLLRIARNKFSDHYRQTRATLPLEAAQDLVSQEPPLDQLIIAQLQRAELIAAMQALPPERAEALALRVFGELSVAETAQVMGRSAAAVKMLVHRAVRDLQQRLAAPAEEH